MLGYNDGCVVWWRVLAYWERQVLGVGCRGVLKECKGVLRVDVTQQGGGWE